jgi:magnesium-transporting ATPase (P-type)
MIFMSTDLVVHPRGFSVYRRSSKILLSTLVLCMLTFFLLVMVHVAVVFSLMTFVPLEYGL